MSGKHIYVVALYAVIGFIATATAVPLLKGSLNTDPQIETHEYNESTSTTDDVVVHVTPDPSENVQIHNHNNGHHQHHDEDRTHNFEPNLCETDNQTVTAATTQPAINATTTTATTVSANHTSTRTHIAKREVVENATQSLTTVSSTETTTQTSTTPQPSTILSSTTVTLRPPSTTSILTTTTGTSTESENITTSNQTTEGPTFPTFEDKSFMESLKETIRKVVSYSVGVLLTPFLIGAHYVPTENPMDANNIESNKV